MIPCPIRAIFMNKPMTVSRQPKGFTLMEMLVVITIIVMLAGLTVAGIGFVNIRKANSQAQVQIALLSKAIEEYKLDNGVYPGDLADSPIDGDISEELYQALFLDGYLDQVAAEVNPRKMYLPELDPRSGKQSWVQRSLDDTVANIPIKILDPWRRPYLYRKGADAQNPDFDLWSTGKDGKTDELNADRSIDVNRDDIRNF